MVFFFVQNGSRTTAVLFTTDLEKSRTKLPRVALEDGRPGSLWPHRQRRRRRRWRRRRRPGHLGASDKHHRSGDGGGGRHSTTRGGGESRVGGRGPRFRGDGAGLEGRLPPIGALGAVLRRQGQEGEGKARDAKKIKKRSNNRAAHTTAAHDGEMMSAPNAEKRWLLVAHTHIKTRKQIGDAEREGGGGHGYCPRMGVEPDSRAPCTAQQ